MTAGAWTLRFTIMLTIALLTAPLAGEAQPAAGAPRIGILIPTAPPPARQPWLGAFREAPRELGYVEGQTVLLDVRWSPVEIGRYEEPLLGMIRLPVDVIVVPTTSAAIVAKRATTTIPIVAASAGFVVESGVVASLARPWGRT